MCCNTFPLPQVCPTATSAHMGQVNAYDHAHTINNTVKSIINTSSLQAAWRPTFRAKCNAPWFSRLTRNKLLISGSVLPSVNTCKHLTRSYIYIYTHVFNLHIILQEGVVCVPSARTGQALSRQSTHPRTSSSYKCNPGGGNPVFFHFKCSLCHETNLSLSRLWDLNWTVVFSAQWRSIWRKQIINAYQINRPTSKWTLVWFDWSEKVVQHWIDLTEGRGTIMLEILDCRLLKWLRRTVLKYWKKI